MKRKLSERNETKHKTTKWKTNQKEKTLPWKNKELKMEEKQNYRTLELY